MTQEVLMTLNTPLGDTLKIRSLSASERMGRLFEFSVQALAEADATVDLASLLDQGAAVGIGLAGGGARWFHGVVAAAGLEGTHGKLVSYRLLVRPWLWRLTRRADNRIFQQKTVEAILREVFANYVGTFRFSLEGNYPTYDYCVQYRETDFNFASRLMEREGLYYYFEHEENDHVLVICDKMSVHVAYPGAASEIPFRESQDRAIDLEAIVDWRHNFELPPSKVTLTDYDYLQPSTSLLKEEPTGRSPNQPKYEYYDHPGDYLTTGEGGRYAQIRMEELDARYQRISGATDTVRVLAAGRRFTLKEHPLASENTDYVVVSTQIEAQYAGYESGRGDSHFDCRFNAIRGDGVYRSERTTPKPVVPGPQTAKVVGPSGEEIYTDEHGRVKVQFHWDRLGQNDENSSCWLRVSSAWAGKAWGQISLPRIGQEVVVDFIEGDPDRPLVTGRVHNAEQITPYLLPDNKTVSTLLSRSTVGGDKTHFNELAFEDKTGEEFIRLHAEKDLLEVVKNDAHRHVTHDQFLYVEHDLTEEIGHDVHRKIGNDQVEDIGANWHRKVGTDEVADIGSKLGVKTGADMSFQSGASYSVKSGSSGDIKIGANLGIDASANIHIKAGANVVIEAGAMMTIKAGAMLNIEASGILSINGSLVKINSGGGGGGGGGANPLAPASPNAPNEIQPLKDYEQDVKTKLENGR